MDKAYAIQTVRKIDMQLMNYLRKVKAPLEGIRYKDEYIRRKEGKTAGK